MSRAIERGLYVQAAKEVLRVLLVCAERNEDDALALLGLLSGQAI